MDLLVLAESLDSFIVRTVVAGGRMFLSGRLSGGKKKFWLDGRRGIELKKFAKVLAEPTRLQECPHRQNEENFWEGQYWYLLKASAVR
jgi:hypothetical protein